LLETGCGRLSDFLIFDGTGQQKKMAITRKTKGRRNLPPIRLENHVWWLKTCYNAGIPYLSPLSLDNIFLSA
jgi:hypothetical protein